MICGLEKTPELNGKVCSLEGYDENAHRWNVRLEDGSGKRVKPQNLRTNPKQVATEALVGVAEPLRKYDEKLAELEASTAQLHQSLATTLDQQRATDEIPDCPGELRANIASMVEKIRTNMSATLNQIQWVSAERTAVQAQGSRLVIEMVSRLL